MVAVEVVVGIGQHVARYRSGRVDQHGSSHGDQGDVVYPDTEAAAVIGAIIDLEVEAISTLAHAVAGDGSRVTGCMGAALHQRPGTAVLLVQRPGELVSRAAAAEVPDAAQVEGDLGRVALGHLEGRCCSLGADTGATITVDELQGIALHADAIGRIDSGNAPFAARHSHDIGLRDHRGFIATTLPLSVVSNIQGL